MGLSHLRSRVANRSHRSAFLAHRRASNRSATSCKTIDLGRAGRTIPTPTAIAAVCSNTVYLPRTLSGRAGRFLVSSSSLAVGPYAERVKWKTTTF